MISQQPVQPLLSTAIDLQSPDSRLRCKRELARAMREMGAFVMAVRKLYGSEDAARAAEYWIERAERAKAPLIDGYLNWRQITIAAADQLAKDRSLARLSGPAPDGASQPS